MSDAELPDAELLVCTVCGYQHVRPLGRKMTLPCRCGNTTWERWELRRGERLPDLRSGEMEE